MLGADAAGGRELGGELFAQGLAVVGVRATGGTHAGAVVAPGGVWQGSLWPLLPVCCGDVRFPGRMTPFIRARTPAISAVLVATPLSFLELPFFSCLSVCLCHSV